MIKRLRAMRMGLETVLGLRRQGFFIPYRYAPSVPKIIPVYDEFGTFMRGHEPALAAVLDSIDAHQPALTALGGDAPQPRWTQDWFPRLDGAAAYVLARDTPPKRIVEVGSGHSTRFLARALADAGATAAQVCIDPAPRAQLLNLKVSWRRKVLGPEDMDLFDALQPGDMAVFDSSHILMPGTDVDIIVNRILPRLAKGVRVHIHDVFLPDPYPANWAWRGYCEHNALAGWLMGGAYRPIWASHYAATRMDAGARPAIAALPWSGAPESSLWMERA
jgi:hypothetical protein